MDGGLGLDVDFIAGELGGQAGVLPLLADGQGELVIRHRHPAALGTFQGLDGEHVGRGEGGGHEGGGVVAVFDDVDLFAAQFGHHIVHPGALGAHAGADGVHVLVSRPDGHLGAAAGLPGDGLHLHGAVIDLGDFQLEQALDQAGMGPGNENLRAAGGAADIHQAEGCLRFTALPHSLRAFWHRSAVYCRRSAGRMQCSSTPRSERQ